LAQGGHRDGGSEALAEDVADRNHDGTVVEHKGVVPVTADRRLAVAGPMVGREA
jgi:hypothetical protein